MGLRRPVGSLEALAAQLTASLPSQPVVLVGHSQSCQVVVAAAQRDPRVAGLVLLGPTTDPPLLRRRVLAARWARTAVAEPWWQAPLVLAPWLRTGPRAMAALWRRLPGGPGDPRLRGGPGPGGVAALGRRLAGAPVAQRLRGVAVPVVVVRGRRDALCPHDGAVPLAGCAPRGRLVELPRAAHMTPQTRPADVAAVVRGLL